MFRRTRQHLRSEHCGLTERKPRRILSAGIILRKLEFQNEMSMNKILLPVDFPNTQPGVVHQAAFLARHFHSEIILLHVVTPHELSSRNTGEWA